MIRHLQHPHTRYSQLAGTPSLCIQMRRNDPKTQTTQILKQYYKLTIVNWTKVRRQFWALIGYVLAQLLILNNFNQKKLQKAAAGLKHLFKMYYNNYLFTLKV